MQSGARRAAGSGAFRGDPGSVGAARGSPRAMHHTKRVRLLALPVLAVGLASCIPPRGEPPQPPARTETFAEGNATAEWIDGELELFVGTDTGVDYAGAELRGTDASAPVAAPSFRYYSEVAGPSVGSPRLVIQFTDTTDGSDQIELRPVDLVAGEWTTVDGDDALWDAHGGTCGFLYGVTYAEALACHAGQSVTDVFVVSDSGYAYPPDGLTLLVDDIDYEGAVIRNG